MGSTRHKAMPRWEAANEWSGGDACDIDGQAERSKWAGAHESTGKRVSFNRKFYSPVQEQGRPVPNQRSGQAERLSQLERTNPLAPRDFMIYVIHVGFQDGFRDASRSRSA